mgnify:CR=1 FL=1
MTATQLGRLLANHRSLRLVLLSGDWIPVTLPGRLTARVSPYVRSSKAVNRFALPALTSSRTETA